MQARDIFLKHFRTVRLNTRFKIKEESIFGTGEGGGMHTSFDLHIDSVVSRFCGPMGAIIK